MGVLFRLFDPFLGKNTLNETETVGEEAADLVDGGGEASADSEDVPAGHQVVAMPEGVGILVGDGGEVLEGGWTHGGGIPAEVKVLCGNAGRGRGGDSVVAAD